jgi:acyl transferase domain-containing protein
MAELGPTYEEHLQSLVSAKSPSIPFYSSVTGKLATETNFGPEYWRSNLESPVEFFPAVKAMINNQGPDQLFLELGPHSALGGPLRQIFAASAAKGRRVYLPSLVRGVDAVGCLLEMAGQLYLKSMPVQFENLMPKGKILTDLPNYPWNHEQVHWTEPRAVKDW